jgi:thymidylate synthase (FAD)
VSEYSARYSILDKEFYIPEQQDIRTQGTANKQGGGDVVDAETAARVQWLLLNDAMDNYKNYEVLLQDMDISRELARMNLTLNTYTQWYWKTDLHNLFHFLSLRADPHAQFEIRAYADEMMKITDAWVPKATQAFRDYRLHAVSFSAQGMAVLKRMLRGEAVSLEDSGMGKREFNEVMGVLER